MSAERQALWAASAVKRATNHSLTPLEDLGIAAPVSFFGDQVDRCPPAVIRAGDTR